MNLKRNLLLLLSLVSTTLFVSCSNAKDEPEMPFDIVGTQWEATYHLDLSDPKSALVGVTYDFNSPTEVTFKYMRKEGVIDPDDMELLETTKYSYTYAKPSLKIFSPGGLIKTVYKVDEKAGVMSIVGKEVFENGKWIQREYNDNNTVLRLKK